MMKKLLFVTSRLPWPINSGRKESLYHYCRLLATHHGYEVSLFVFPEWDQPRDAAGKPDFIKNVYFARPIGGLTKCVSLLGALFSRKMPFQCALYHSRKNEKALARIIEKEAPDTVILDMIRTAPYMRAVGGRARVILDLDDLLSVRYARQLAAFDKSMGIAGRYAGGMSRGMEKLLCHGRVGKMILRAEQRRVSRAEILYTNRSSGAILVSDVEAKKFAKAVRVPVISIPIGVDVAALAPKNTPEKAPHVMGFIGNLSVEANLASLTHIVKNILPHTSKKARLEVVGQVPPSVREAFSDEPRLHFLGEVDALAPVLHRWQLMLSPIAFGSGIKTKILTAMAAGLPVVTNDLGAEGIDAKNGEEIIVENDVTAQICATNALLENEARAQAIGAAAHLFTKKHFDWEAIAPNFLKIL